MKYFAFLLVILIISVLIWPSTNELRMATFNIEDFPKSEQQIDAAFKQIEALKVSVVALQEIMNPVKFAKEAKARLGKSWYFVVPPERKTPARRVAVLYDSTRLDLLEILVDEGPRLGGNYRPALMLRLRDLKTNKVYQVISIHLKAGGQNAGIRAKQLKRLEKLLLQDRGTDQLVLMGDFNATSNEDRKNIQSLAKVAGLTWATKDLKCTSYSNRRDKCVGSALDHALSSVVPNSTVAKGACARVGCSSKPQCPVEYKTLSDHCPVMLELP